MVNLSTRVGPGLHFENQYAEDVTASVAFTKGDTCQFDIGQTVATSNSEGVAASGLNTIIVPVTAGLRWGILGVVMETVAAGAKTKVLVKGLVQAQTTGTPAKHLGLTAANTVKTLAVTGGTGMEKVIAITMETGTASPTYVLFDGINGFDSDGA